VVFRNKVVFPFSIHPHGVFYDKNNEGALYADNHPDKTVSPSLSSCGYSPFRGSLLAV